MACQTGYLPYLDADGCEAPFAPSGAYPSFVQFNSAGEFCDEPLGASTVPAVNTNAIVADDPDTVQGQLDYLTASAVSQDPFRLVGAAGDEQAAAQPVDNDGDILVADDIQHTGNTLLGEFVGSPIQTILGPKVHFRPMAGRGIHINTDSISHVWDNDGVNVADGSRYGLSVQPTTVDTDRGYMRFFPLTDADTVPARGFFVTDRRGNAGLYSGFNGAKNGAFKVFVMDDRSTAAAQDITTPPAAPWATTEAYLYPQTAGTADLFVMNGAGAVTLLSSHPEVAAELMPDPMNPSGRYNFDYNVFSGIGQIKDVGAPYRTLVFDMSSGAYDIYDKDGEVLSSGQHEELAIEGRHPLPSGSSSRGQLYYEAWCRRVCSDSATNARRFDAGDEETLQAFSSRPEVLTPQDLTTVEPRDADPVHGTSAPNKAVFRQYDHKPGYGHRLPA